MQVDIAFKRGEPGVLQGKGIGHLLASGSSQGPESLVSSDQLGRHENMDFIDMVTITKGSQQPGTALDKHIGHLPLSQFRKQAGNGVTGGLELEHLASRLFKPGNLFRVGFWPAADQHREIGCCLEELGIRGYCRMVGNDDAQRNSWPGGAGCQQGIVTCYSPASHDDGIHATAQLVDDLSGGFTGNPLAAPCPGRNATVECHGPLGDNPGRPTADRLAVGCQQFPSFLLEQALVEFLENRQDMEEKLAPKESSSPQGKGRGRNAEGDQPGPRRRGGRNRSTSAGVQYWPGGKNERGGKGAKQGRGKGKGGKKGKGKGAKGARDRSRSRGNANETGAPTDWPQQWPLSVKCRDG